ncbi:MAG: hypothetical protein COB79_02830 [Zetaproteobacteria bacterium]|nr:MAG: hypothetical protein COB79_02830 [Zetaproteobacteria bacterium]
MYRKLLIVGLLLVSMGCVKKTVTFENTTELKSYSFKFLDSHKSDATSFLTENGNIYSCMYGVEAVSEEDIKPNKTLILKNYLENRLKAALTNKVVELKRFDIYYNTQKALRATATPVAIPGTALMIPLHLSSGGVFGCYNEVRGEYFLLEIPEVIRKELLSVFVLHLQVKVNDSLFNIRTTSLNPVATPKLKGTDEYVDILKVTISEALYMLEKDILNQLKPNNTVKATAPSS